MMSNRVPLKSLKSGLPGGYGTVAAKIAELSDQGPHPMMFLALYLNLCYLPFTTPSVTV